jgi:hypothetical protein
MNSKNSRKVKKINPSASFSDTGDLSLIKIIANNIKTKTRIPDY